MVGEPADNPVSPSGTELSVHRSILVVGGGIAGITAAVEAAETGFDVVIVEKEASLGGRVAQLNKYFPKLCPPTCGLEINFQRVKKNPRIRFYTLAEVEEISGQPGNFDVTVKQRARYVTDRCTACNACVEACPVSRPDSFNLGMANTKAIYLPHAMAFPMKYAIDDSACKLNACAECVSACKYDAIDLDMQHKTFNLKVGAVIMATGWKPYDASRIDNLGFGRYADVITNMMMERMAAPNGPTEGKILRPSDGGPVNSVAFVQCAGQRDRLHLGYCSGICCLGSLKQATYVTAQNEHACAHIFYIDLRTPGTYGLFSRRVRGNGNISVIKGKVAKIVEDPKEHTLIVEAEDTVSAKKIRVNVDLVVLATGMVANLEGEKPAAEIVYDEDHFVSPDSTAPGIFVAGCARGPVDVATAAQDATAAALKAINGIRAAAERLG
jgi:quinone-modifying oxidoreductase subunit QmoA